MRNLLSVIISTFFAHCLAFKILIFSNRTYKYKKNNYYDLKKAKFNYYDYPHIFCNLIGLLSLSIIQQGLNK